MFDALLQWEILHKIVLNVLFVSIPEEFFLVMFTLILMGEFDYWKENECKKLFVKWDYIRVLTPVLVSAFASNIMRYTGVNIAVSFPLLVLIMFVCIVLTGDIWNDASALKWMGKAFLFLLFSMLILIITELLYLPFILEAANKTIQDVNNNVLVNFVISLPSRAIQYSILVFLVLKKRTLLEGNIIRHILKSKILSILTFTIIILDLFFTFIIAKAIIYDNIFVNSSYMFQFVIVICALIFPILNISALFWGVYYVKNQESVKQKLASDKLKKLVEDLRLYTNNGEYDNIKWKLNGLENEMQDIALNLFTEGKLE